MMEVCKVEKRAGPHLFPNSKLWQSDLLGTYLEEPVQGWGEGSWLWGGCQRCFRMGTVIFLSLYFFVIGRLWQRWYKKERNRDYKCTVFGTSGKNSLDIVGPQNTIFGIPQYSETWLRKWREKECDLQCHLLKQSCDKIRISRLGK